MRCGLQVRQINDLMQKAHDWLKKAEVASASHAPLKEMRLLLHSGALGVHLQHDIDQLVVMASYRMSTRIISTRSIVFLCHSAQRGCNGSFLCSC